LAVSFTGVYFAFPIPVAGAIVIATRGSIREALTYVSLPKSLPFAPGTPLLSLDQAIKTANKVLPPDAPVTYLQIPQKASDVFVSVSYYDGTVQYAQLRRVAIDPHSGTILRMLDTHSMPVGCASCNTSTRCTSDHLGARESSAYSSKPYGRCWDWFLFCSPSPVSSCIGMASSTQSGDDFERSRADSVQYLARQSR
jgi:hypothetical protein